MDSRPGLWILVGIFIAVLLLHTERLSNAFFKERAVKPQITTTAE